MFITLEGGEGAGKSTQAALLADALCARGLPVLRTREPGGAPGSERLRTLLLSGEIDWASRTEAMLHFAARIEHVEKTIKPALAAGMWVICDRFFDSTLAYQGYGQGADKDFIRQLIGLVGLIPDLTLMLEVSPATSASRLRSRGQASDRYERLDEAFHARVAAGFAEIAAAEPNRCVRIDANGDLQSVHAAIVEAVLASGHPGRNADRM